jgi:hypothetical protein
VLRAFGGRAENDGRRRYGIVRPMMLADAKYLESCLIGELDLLDQIPETLRRAHGDARARIRCGFSERVETELHAQG